MAKIMAAVTGCFISALLIPPTVHPEESTRRARLAEGVEGLGAGSGPARTAEGACSACIGARNRARGSESGQRRTASAEVRADGSTDPVHFDEERVVAVRRVDLDVRRRRARVREQ